jgi:hypothetical protein
MGFRKTFGKCEYCGGIIYGYGFIVYFAWHDCPVGKAY